MYNYTQELLDKIRRTSAGYIESLGYEIIAVTLSKVSGALTLRFLVDRPAGGISIAECADLNEQLGILLDKENILEERYVLEVSSPGVDRPLVTERDFLRVSGRQVRVFLSEPIKGRMDWEGIVDKVQDNSLFLEIGEEIARIPLNNIKKAKQVVR